MVLPNAYQQTAPAIASYDYENIANATGYETYYGFDTEDDEVRISSSAISSKVGYTEKESTGTSEKNFDLIYNTPRNVSGTLFVSVTSAVENTGGTGASSCTVSVRPIYYDGSTETQLATQQTSDSLSAAEGNDASTRTTFAFENIDQHFRKGDILRFEIILTATMGAGGIHSTYLFHDGDNTAITDLTQVNDEGSPQSTDLIFNIPYKIEL